MKEIFYTLLGSIITIFVSWVFNLITNKRQHKMEMHRIAVQNKLETSKKAISWLQETKNELFVVIWALEHFQELGPGMMGGILERAERLTKLEIEAKSEFNAIELYYNLDDVVKRYNIESIMPQLLSLQNSMAILRNYPQEDTIVEFKNARNDTLIILKQLSEAISEIIEIIRKDNLGYLK